MKKLTEIQKAYIAGFVDGEACITISKRKGILSNNYTFQVQIIITNSNLEVLKKINEYIGVGKVRENLKWSGHKQNWKPIHRLELWSNNAKDFIKEILPYLIVKKEIAQKVLDFPIKRGGRRTENEYNDQQKLIIEIRLINKRGL